MRIRTFVVDDEPLILRNIKKSIETTNPEFKIVGEAMDGETAFRLIQEIRPDVIFTDIRMPLLGGLELIKKLREAGNSAQIVLLSGYKEFEYAKEAIRLSVSDYLIKPIDPQALSDLLRDLQVTCLNSLSGRQYAYLERGGSSLEHPAALFPGCAAFQVVQVCLGSRGLHAEHAVRKFDRPIDYRAILEAISQDGEYWILDGRYGNERRIVRAAGKRVGQDEAFLQTLHRTLTDSAQAFPVTLAHCRIDRIDRFPAACAALERLLTQSLIFAESSLLTDAPDDEPRPKVSLPHAYREEWLAWKNLIGQKKNAELKRSLKALLARCESDRLTQLQLTHLLKKMFADLVRETGSDLEAEELVQAVVQSSFGYAQLQTGLLENWERIACPADSGEPDSVDSEEIVRRIRAYLDSNFSADPSIQEVAERFGFNYSYLCSVFKKYAGKTPNEYMIDKKIEQAKKLLHTTTMSIGSIAVSVGCSDPYYFSRLFKSVTGTPPSAYRKRMEAGNF